MKRLLHLCLLLIGAFVCGCPRTGITVFPPAPMEVHGVYTHEGSGISFPLSVGHFSRGNVIQYDPEATDVGVGYNLNGIRYQMAVTVYVYPAPPVAAAGSSDDIAAAHTRLQRDDFEQVKAGICEIHPGAALIVEGPVTIEQKQTTYDGLHAVFEFDAEFSGRDQTLTSHAYLFTYGDWFVKYRVTYPKDADEMARSRLEEFISDFTWSHSGITAK